jgi:hypothetical protein
MSDPQTANIVTCYTVETADSKPTSLQRATGLADDFFTTAPIYRTKDVLVGIIQAAIDDEKERFHLNESNILIAALEYISRTPQAIKGNGSERKWLNEFSAVANKALAKYRVAVGEEP